MESRESAQNEFYAQNCEQSLGFDENALDLTATVATESGHKEGALFWPSLDPHHEALNLPDRNPFPGDAIWEALYRYKKDGGRYVEQKVGFVDLGFACHAKNICPLFYLQNAACSARPKQLDLVGHHGRGCWVLRQDCNHCVWSYLCTSTYNSFWPVTGPFKW